MKLVLLMFLKEDEKCVNRSILPAEEAKPLVHTVGACTGVQDPRHPIRAALIDVEQFTGCELGKP